MPSEQVSRDLPLYAPASDQSADLSSALKPALTKSSEKLLSLQRQDGYWWFTLEANETIGAEFIFLMHFLGAVDAELMQAIARRIEDAQRPDGTWALYYDGPADLSTTIECYFALKLAGRSPESPLMVKAQEFILSAGGLEQSRVFTRIHLALFGIIPWKVCPEMPVEVMLLPDWFPLNIYEFSSWARASIVPLLIVLSKKPIKPIGVDLDELFLHPRGRRKFSQPNKKGLISWDRIFIHLDQSLKAFSQIPFKPMRQVAIDKAKKWIEDHIQKVEDIYPALSYAAIAYKTLGYSNDAWQIEKPFAALKMFQQHYNGPSLPPLPNELRDDGVTPPSKLRKETSVPASAKASAGLRVHQQCCISPVWDTPWAVTALLESGIPADHPQLRRAAQWLLKKQIREVRGDWSFKCPKAEPGGWSFEFENDSFPDVDDTIQVLHALRRVALPVEETRVARDLGLRWAIAMQNDDGGWGAFDRNNNQELVNKIPFSDHGACLDPSSPDITGRMVELLIAEGFSEKDPIVRRALDYLQRTQESFGGWFGRWGINYIYGTWAVLTGLSLLNDLAVKPLIDRGASWLASIQRPDGGWSESPESYVAKEYLPLSTSVPSQTAWAIMGLVAAGRVEESSARRGVEYLLHARNDEGLWNEQHATGTGFPGHFYIRYHGYRYFFPLLALGRYLKALED